MYHRSLPKVYASGENKGKQALVTITNEKLGFPKTAPITINQDEFVFPQFGPEPEVKVTVTGEGENRKEVREEVPLTEEQARAGINEAIEDAGGATAFLEIHNENTRDQAVKEAKAKIRTAESGKWEDVVRSALELCRKFSWKQAERVTVAVLRQELSDLQTQNIDEMDPDELKNRIKKLLGQA